MGLGNSYRSNDHRESVYEFSSPDRLIWSEIRAPVVFFASVSLSAQRNGDLSGRWCSSCFVLLSAQKNENLICTEE